MADSNTLPLFSIGFSCEVIKTLSELGFVKRKSEMTFGERVSAPGFQIKFEGSRPIFQLEGYVGFHFPRPVFRRVWDASGIVYGETLAQVACTADVPFIRMADAAQNVSIEHNQACCVVFGLVANIKVWFVGASVLLR